MNCFLQRATRGRNRPAGVPPYLVLAPPSESGAQPRDGGALLVQLQIVDDGWSEEGRGGTPSSRGFHQRFWGGASWLDAQSSPRPFSST